MVQTQSNRKTHEHWCFPPASEIQFITQKVTAAPLHFRTLPNVLLWLSQYSHIAETPKIFPESKDCSVPHILGPQALRQCAAKMGSEKRKKINITSSLHPFPKSNHSLYGSYKSLKKRKAYFQPFALNWDFFFFKNCKYFLGDGNSSFHLV